MRRAVVVTLSIGGAAGGCGKEPMVTANPPPPIPVPAPVPAPAPAPASTSVVDPAVLNGTDPAGIVLRDPDGTCHVNLPPPPPEPGVPVMSFRAPIRQVVECPPHMKDPSWDVCAGVVRTGDGGGCICVVIGNPPPPPRPITCPTGPAPAAE